MPDNSPSPTSSPESFTLRDRDRIIDRLRLLGLRQTLLTATPVGAKDGIAVSVIDMLPDRGSLALDTGADPGAIRRLLAAKRVIFRGRLDGVEIRFEVPRVSEAMLDGRTVLAVRIPETLFWLQRRQYFRVFLPPDMPLRCEITLPNGESRWFEVLNLSVRGLALLDKSGQLGAWGRSGQWFQNCRLDLPGFESERLDLEVRSRLETSVEGSGVPILRVGLSFRHIGPRLEARIQRLLHEIETRGRRQRGHLRT